MGIHNRKFHGIPAYDIVEVFDLLRQKQFFIVGAANDERELFTNLQNLGLKEYTDFVKSLDYEKSLPCFMEEIDDMVK